MRFDELRQPLKKRSRFERLWAKRPSLLLTAYVLTLACFIGAGTWARHIPNPFAGEPIVIAKIPPAEEIVTASTTPAEGKSNTTEISQTPEEASGPAEEPQFADAEPVETSEEPTNGKRKPKFVIEQPIEQDVYKQEAGLVISPRRSLTPAPVAEFTEISALGQLPRIGAGGKKPSAVYARPSSLSVIHSDAPKIAIVLGGMGLNAGLTSRAVKELPADVTLAFAPYGEDLQDQVNRARKEGHEVLLQVPLEPVGFPASNPGPKTLLVDSSAGENIDSLYWHMSRFSGYVGVLNYMGGRFLTNASSLNPVLTELRKRGLLFVEDGSLPISATEAVAKIAHADARRAIAVIDADPSPDAIQAALLKLEQQAQTNGIAIGSGSGLAVTIDTLRDWAKEAAERGIIIIPVTAAFKGRMG